MLIFLEIVAAVGLFYCIIALGIYLFQRHLVYRPKGGYNNPKDIGLAKVEEINLDTVDGERLVAWYAPAEPGFPTLLYCHGAIGSLTTRRDRFHRITKRGYGIFAVSYRGYSGSTGRPSQAWLTLDGLMAYDYLHDKLKVAAEKIVIYGESIGTGIAIPIASQKKTAALILEAPYTSLIDIAQHRFKLLPIDYFLHEKYISKKIIGRIKVPTFFMHGRKDKDIPIDFGEALFNAANEPKEMKVFEEAAHTGLFNLGAFNYISDFLERHMNIPKSSVVTPLKKSAAE
ncbi:MAG: alpha/beta hydrolase [Pseudomonadota bacterium]